MAARETIIDVFDRCIDRIQQGEAVDAVLQDYREFASDLRPMLEAGLLLPRARFPATTVAAAEQALEPLIRQTIASVFGGGSIVGIITLVFLLILAAVIAVVVVLPNIRPGPSVIEIRLPALTATSPALIAPSGTPSPTPIASVTTVPNMTPIPASGVIVIEGAVERIDGSTITIYDRDILLEDDDPRLAALQIGDVVRVEGAQTGTVIVVINITFINVVVLVEGDQVWRDDRCDSPPPPWAQGRALDWQRRCGGNPPDSAGGGDGGGNDDDDDD